MMCRRTFFTVLIFLLLAQIFVCSAESADLASAKKEILGLIDSGKIDSAKTAINDFIVSNSGSPLLPESVYNFAEQYYSRHMFDEAVQLYKRIISLDPNDAYAKQATLDISKATACKYIDHSRCSEASALAEKLLADNSKDPYLPKVVARIADYAVTRHYYVEAKALYNRLIQLYPQDDEASQASVKVFKIDILAKIDSGKLKSAESDIEQLISNHLKNSHFGRALYDIAKRYMERGYFDQAKALAQRLAKLCPWDAFADRTKLEIFRYDISSKFEMGDFAVEGLLKDVSDRFPSHSYLLTIYSFAADRYTRNYKYDKAEALYNKILGITPTNSSEGSKAALELAALDIYKKINSGDYNSADSLIEKLIAKNPQQAYLPEVLYNIARYYSTRYHSECFNHERAKKLYLRLIELYPEDNYSSEARVEIAALDIKAKIAMGAFELAQKEFEQFKNSYGKGVFMARKCHDLGDYCLVLDNYDAAISMLESVVRQFPDCYYYHTRAKMRCDTAKICKEIKTGNLSNAQKAIAKLKQDYAENYRLPGELYFIAEAYSLNGHRDLSYALCDEIIKVGKTDYVESSKIHKYRLDIYSRLEANDLDSAKKLLNQFKSEYESSSYLQGGLIELAEEFYEKALRTKDESTVSNCLNVAIDICKDKDIIENPSGAIRGQAYSFLGDSYLRLNDFTKSISYFQKLVDEYPDNHYSWNAQFMIGQIYEKMVKANLLSKSEGDPLIQTAYTNVLKNYPYCKVATTAKSWLDSQSN